MYTKSLYSFSFSCNVLSEKFLQSTDDIITIFGPHTPGLSHWHVPSLMLDFHTWDEYILCIVWRFCWKTKSEFKHTLTLVSSCNKHRLVKREQCHDIRLSIQKLRYSQPYQNMMFTSITSLFYSFKRWSFVTWGEVIQEAFVLL